MGITNKISRLKLIFFRGIEAAVIFLDLMEENKYQTTVNELLITAMEFKLTLI